MIPKIGVILTIDNVDFVLVFSISFGNYLLLDTIHGTDSKKIKKTLAKSLPNYNDFTNHIAQSYPNKNIPLQDDFIQFWLRDAATPIVTEDRQLRAFSDFNQSYVNSINDKKIAVKFGLLDYRAIH